MGNTCADQGSSENGRSEASLAAIVNPDAPSALPVLPARENVDPEALPEGPSEPREHGVEIVAGPLGALVMVAGAPNEDTSNVTAPGTANAGAAAEAGAKQTQEELVIRFLPKVANDKVVLMDEGESRFRANNAALKADADGIFYRYSKQFDDRDNKRPLVRWGASVAGADDGDGWIKVNMATEDRRDPEKEPFQDKMYRLACDKLQRPLADVPGLGPRRPSSENISFDEYTKMHRSEFNRILALEKPDGWEFKKEEEGVKIYTKEEEGQDLLYFKGVSDFEAEKGPLDILMQILKTEDRPKWDELCIKGETPQFFAPYYKYAYCQLKARAGIISARDLVNIGRLRFEKDGAIVITIQSTYHEDYPEQPGFVRMNFIEGGYIVRPKQDKPGWVTVTWTGCVDPKGWLPTFLVNLLVAKQALTLAKIKEHMAAHTTT